MIITTYESPLRLIPSLLTDTAYKEGIIGLPSKRLQNYLRLTMQMQKSHSLISRVASSLFASLPLFRAFHMV
jgi:hypothetical protein